MLWVLVGRSPTLPAADMGWCLFEDFSLFIFVVEKLIPRFEFADGVLGRTSHLGGSVVNVVLCYVLCTGLMIPYDVW